MALSISGQKTFLHEALLCFRGNLATAVKCHQQKWALKQQIPGPFITPPHMATLSSFMNQIPLMLRNESCTLGEYSHVVWRLQIKRR